MVKNQLTSIMQLSKLLSIIKGENNMSVLIVVLCVVMVILHILDFIGV